MREKVVPAEVFLPEHAELRQRLLQTFHGYQANRLLLRAFPEDARWRRAELTVSDFDTVFCAHYPIWLALSKGTRRVVDGAHNLEIVPVTDSEGRLINANILAVSNAIRQRGIFFPELLAAVDDRAPAKIVVFEGHTRATAVVHARTPHPIPFIIGSSPTMHSWWLDERDQLSAGRTVTLVAPLPQECAGRYLS